MNRTLLVFSVALTLALAGCGGGSGGSTPPPAITIAITQTSFGYGVIGQPYPGMQLTASGGTPPYTWSAAGVPTGMTFSNDGKLSGNTPGQNEDTFLIAVTVNDSAGHSGLNTLSLNSYLPLSASVTAKEVSSGVPYNGALFIRTNQNVVTNARIVQGALPPGLSLSATPAQGANSVIAINGTPTQRGIFSFTVELTDSLTPPRIAQVALKIFVDVRELYFFFPGSALARGFRTQSYEAPVGTGGGVAPINCALAPGSGPLPPGITVGANCTVSGTPTATGTFNFSLRATDSGTPQQTVDGDFSLNIVDPLTLAPLPDATTGESYVTTLNISGGTPPYKIVGAYFSTCCFVVEEHDFTLHGVPYQAGSPLADIIVTDQSGQMLRPFLQFNVNPGPFRPSVDALPRMRLNQSYESYLMAIAGTEPITWTIESGALPSGLSLMPSSTNIGWFFGTPSTTGTYPFVLKATDSSTPPQTLQIPVSLEVYSKLPRNDSVATAETYAGPFPAPFVGYGLQRNISPYSDPVDLGNPDHDYFHLRAFAGETIKIDVGGSPSTLDPVMEILDSNGQRFSTCRDPSDDTPDANGKIDPTPLAFDDVCMNDDIVPGVNISSSLTFRVPGSSGTIVDYYVHVLDFRGDARPDMRYPIFVNQQLYHVD